MNSVDASRPASSDFSMRRVLTVLIPLVALVACIFFYQRQAIEAEARQNSEKLMIEKLGLSKPTKNRLDSQFTDENGDLVADTPKDKAQQIDPDRLVFSYIGASDAQRQQEVWKDFVDALSTATGRTVEYLVIETPDDQLRALKDGKLHIAGINTGNVPTAVSACGFVPVCTLGRPDGTYGYTMKVIVPATSLAKSVDDLRGKRLALTDRLSNSGFKAPLVLLMNDFGLYPQRDFEWSFTFGHDESIRGIIAGDYDAAPVASDMLARAESRDDIQKDQYRVIYESERFPPAALGYVYRLKPDLAEKIKEVFSSFKWEGTGLEKEFAATGVTSFVPVDYKDDWSLIRRIDDTMGTMHVIK